MEVFNIKNIIKISLLLPLLLILNVIETTVANADELYSRHIQSRNHYDSINYDHFKVSVSSDLEVSGYKHRAVIRTQSIQTEKDKENLSSVNNSEYILYTNLDYFPVRIEKGTNYDSFIVTAQKYVEMRENLYQGIHGPFYSSSGRDDIIVMKNGHWFAQSSSYDRCELYEIVSTTAPFKDSNGEVFQPPKEEGGGGIEEDIPNFEWEGDGVKLNFPNQGQIIKGYTSSQGGALMDFQIYGKFHYTPSLLEFDKQIQTQIVNSVVVRLGDKTKMMGSLGGAGLKSFEWVTRPGDSDDGLIKFKLTGYIPIWSKGQDLDFTVGASLPIGDGNFRYYSDSTNVTTKQTNGEAFEDGYVPPTDGEDSGQIGGGNSWNPKPEKPDDQNNSIIDWIRYLIDSLFYLITAPFRMLMDMVSSALDVVTDLFSSVSGLFEKFGQAFTYLPSQVKSVISGGLVIMVFISIFRYFRGA